MMAGVLKWKILDQNHNLKKNKNSSFAQGPRRFKKVRLSGKWEEERKEVDIKRTSLQ